ncbi:hypothetical protein IGI04_018949, partial [Brassica rapa subsp. trilocularis]
VNTKINLKTLSPNPSAASASSSRSEVFSGRRTSPCCLSDDGGALGIRAVAGRWFVFGEVGFCVMACSFRLQDECVGCLVSGLSSFLSSSYLLWLWKDFDLCRLLALEGKCSLPAYVYSTTFHPF